MAIYHAVEGNWSRLRNSSRASEAEMAAFLEYAAIFLAGTGNYRVRTYTIN
jgi:hypothetical protein